MGKARIQDLITQLAGEQTLSHRPEDMQERLTKFVEELNQSSVAVYPEEVDVLEEICRLIDNEPDADTAWTKVRNVELTGVYSQPPELNSLTEAIGFNILNSTIAYINLATHKAASGVVVEIEGRIFLATTAHSLPDNPSGKLSFVGENSTKIDENVPAILSFAKDQNEELRDVAFVELAPGFVQSHFGKSAIPLARVYPCRTGHEEAWTFVGGYPGDEVRNIDDESRRIRTKLFTMQGWCNKVLTPEYWHVLERSQREPDEELDVFIPYPRDDEFEALGPLKQQKPDVLCEPFGMSGGGYWQPQVAIKRNIFTPEYYSLIAIQSRWWKLGRYLQATQIIHWLRLLWNHRPGLREALESSFPDHDLIGE